VKPKRGQRAEAMWEQIQLLVKLQQMDSQSQRLDASLAEVPRRLEGLEAERRQADDLVVAAQNQAALLTKRYRELERDNQACEGQIAKSKAKLAAVKTNKEYQSSLKEIEDLEAKRSLVEDQSLALLEDIDACRAQLEEKKKQCHNIKGQVDQDQQEIQAEALQLQQELARLGAERQALMAQVRPDVLEAFAMVKQRVGRGLTIAPVENAVCRGCNVGIPPQLYNEIQRRDKLYHCPNCQRLVYWQSPQG